MNVSINPLEPKGSLPWVRFAAGNGWSIYDTQIKGCHCASLEDAVNDYNRSVRRKVKALNIGKLLEGSELDKLPLMNCPGWGDAVRDEMISRNALVPPPVQPCPREIWVPTVEPVNQAAPAPEAKEARQPFPKPPAGLLGMLGILAAMGALDGILEDASDIIDEETNPQIIKLLREAGIMREIPGPIPGTVAGIVAIPRSFGEQFANDVEGAIRGGNPTALLVLLSGAGLVP